MLDIPFIFKTEFLTSFRIMLLLFSLRNFHHYLENYNLEIYIVNIYTNIYNNSPKITKILHCHQNLIYKHP